MSSRSMVLFIIIITGITIMLMINFLPPSSNEVTPNPIDLQPVIDENSKGTVGYVIVKGKTIYFINENDLPNDDVENIAWTELSGNMGHPADAVLVGEPVNAIEKELSTGDKVEIWFTQIRESYPGQIVVEKIKKY